MQNYNKTNQIDICEHAENAYRIYSMSVVKGRALPQVQDGLKPVHRRILFAMSELGLTHTAKHVKSARVVGDVLGKYHPHGDTAAYDAMVRMAQPFSLRYPLVDGQGNFGSRDGDGAAAMRYTEVKLTALAQLLLKEIHQDTVDYVPNYDGTHKEPELLSARLPMILLNGGEGIAVGMANNIPSHNLTEVCNAVIALIEKPNTSLDEILEIIKGPDFPDGGMIVSPKQAIYDAYQKGRGSIKVRARYQKEQLARGQWKIVVTDLPYQVSVSKILMQIGELSDPTIQKGKKTLTPAQVALKQLTLSLLDSVVDESNKDSPIRIVIYPSSSKVDEQQLMNFLYENTSLQDNFAFNLTMIGNDYNPGRLGLLDILNQWIYFRKTVLRRRLEFQKAGLEKRLHILTGRLIVFLNIDKVIEIIRHSDSPDERLKEEFDLSDAQVQDVLEMKLRQLNNLEGIKLEKEIESLKKEIDRITKILNSTKLFDKLLISEIQEDQQMFGDERRTEINPLNVDESSSRQLKKEMLKADDMYVAFSHNGWVRAFKTAPGNVAYKVGDSKMYEGAYLRGQVILAVSNKGRVYQLDPTKIPITRGDGIMISALIAIPQEDHLHSIIVCDEEATLFMAATIGYGFICPAKSLCTKLKNGKSFLDVGDGIVGYAGVVDKDTLGQYLVVAKAGKSHSAFGLNEVESRPSGGKGLKLFGIKDQVIESIGLIANTKESISEYCGQVGAKPTKLVGKRGKSL